MATVETLEATVQELRSLRLIVYQYKAREKQDYEQKGEPFDHVYHDLCNLEIILRKHDNQKEQERKDDAALNELAVRLTQG